MADIYLTLEQAAELEKIQYKTLAKRLERKADYQIRTEQNTAGGKDLVYIALSSLSAKAQRQYQKQIEKELKQEEDKEQTKIMAKKKKPWYVDMDLNWYRQRRLEEYNEKINQAQDIKEFLACPKAERKQWAEDYQVITGISPRTLYRLAQTTEEAMEWAVEKERQTGFSYDYFRVLCLCRKLKQEKNFTSLTEEQKALIENIWFDQGFSQNRGSMQLCFEIFMEEAEKKGWEMLPSGKTVERYINHLMNTGYGRNAKFLQMHGLREFKNKKMLKGKRDTKSLQVMEFVQGDEHTFDCWVSYTMPNGKVKAIRPKLVAWIDTRSRCILGDVICENANTQILKQSIIKMIYSELGGVPKHLHIDNGKDYTSRENTGQNRKDRKMQQEMVKEVQGFYRSVGIEDWSRSLPYQPWSKAQVERFFGTVCRRFSRRFASYTGTLSGSKTDGKVKKDIPGMLERGELYTIEEFYALWEIWLREKYHGWIHRGLKDAGETYHTPVEVFNNEERYEKAVPPRDYAAMLLLKSGTALVRQQGIAKFGTIYTDYSLAAWEGQTVNIRWDVDDVTKLYVYAADGSKIGEAHAEELLKFTPNISQEALEKHIRNQKRQIKETFEAAKGYTASYEQRAENASPTVVGTGSFTLKPKVKEKVVKLVTDKQYQQERSTKKEANANSDFLTRKGEEAIAKLKELAAN